MNTDPAWTLKSRQGWEFTRRLEHFSSSAVIRLWLVGVISALGERARFAARGDGYA